MYRKGADHNLEHIDVRVALWHGIALYLQNFNAKLSGRKSFRYGYFMLWKEYCVVVVAVFVCVSQFRRQNYFKSSLNFFKIFMVQLKKKQTHTHTHTLFTFKTRDEKYERISNFVYRLLWGNQDNFKFQINKPPKLLNLSIVISIEVEINKYGLFEETLTQKCK